jgi:hypothetical protein
VTLPKAVVEEIDMLVGKAYVAGYNGRIFEQSLSEEIARIARLAAAPLAPQQGWISVNERLPDDEPLQGIPYMEFGARPVLVLHSDRPDYPITAHAIFSDNPSARGVAISTNGASRFKYVCWYSVGRELSNPFDLAHKDGIPFKDSAGYSKWLPKYFGLGITHWAPILPLPDAPREPKEEK